MSLSTRRSSWQAEPRLAITQSKNKSYTAGMIYCFRSCGVSLGHEECIHAEVRNDILNTLFFLSRIIGISRLRSVNS